MTVILDTSVLIDYLRGAVAARDAVNAQYRSGRRVAASVLTKVEVLAGVRPAELPATRETLAHVEWIPVTDEIAERAGAHASRFLRSHRHIEVVDYVIAATAETVGGELWTSNRAHFPMFPELSSPY